MTIQFALQDLMLFLVCALGIVAGILLLPTLWNIKRVVGIFRPIVETNKELLKKTIKAVPAIFENAGHISSNVRETTDKLKVSVPVILQDIERSANAAKVSIGSAGVMMENVGLGINEAVAGHKKDENGFMPNLRIIKEVLTIVQHTFSSGK